LTDPLTTAIGRLVGRVAHWTPARWAKPVAAGDRSRADVVHALAQRLADTAADATGEPRRPVPRLDNDLALPDQLRVLAADLSAALPSGDALTSSVADVRAVSASL
jgi:hypothetical protein